MLIFRGVVPFIHVCMGGYNPNCPFFNITPLYTGVIIPCITRKKSLGGALMVLSWVMLVPPKKIHSKQGSFGFQVYTYSIPSRKLTYPT